MFYCLKVGSLIDIKFAQWIFESDGVDKASRGCEKDGKLSSCKTHDSTLQSLLSKTQFSKWLFTLKFSWSFCLSLLSFHLQTR